MANPFLMDDDLPSSTNDQYSNPFLIEEAVDNQFVGFHSDYKPPVNDNPFFAEIDPAPVMQAAGGAVTNPFADFGEDGGDDGNIEMNNEIITTTSSSSVNFFGSNIDSVAAVNPNIDFFSSAAEIIPTTTTTSSSNSSHFFDTTIIEDEPPVKPLDLNIKLANSMNAAFDDNAAYSSEDELKVAAAKMSKNPPPPRPVPPPSKATQDLIMSVASQLDQHSSHLLDRIPKTRTPSPVSMRDLHSPSPTPDDLLDVLDEPDLMGSVTPNPVIDNPFGITSEIILPKMENNKNQPPRPPPPRPAPPSKPSPVGIPPPIPVQPTRPPPPVVPQSPAVPAPTQEPDLFDMFGTGQPATVPKPPAHKTKEDILSLYSTAPITTNSHSTTADGNNMPDLLSGDLMDDIPPPDPSSATGQITQSDLILNSNHSSPHSNRPEMVEIIEDDVTLALTTDSNPTPQILEDTEQITDSHVVTSTTSMSPSEQQPKATVEEIIEPMELKLDSNIPDLIPTAVSPNVSGIIFNMSVTCEPDNPPSDEEDDLDYQPKPSKQEPVAFEENPTHEAVQQLFTQPDESESDVGIPEADSNPFGGSPPEDNIEPVVEPITMYQPPPTPATGIDFSGSNSETQMDIFGDNTTVLPQENIKKPEDDAFDAFSAKFESKSQSNIFMDDMNSLPNGFDTVATVDAWGDSGNDAVLTTATEGDGFGGDDDGFDSFLTMTAPPAAVAAPSTPFDRNDSRDSDEAAKEFNVFIRPKDDLAHGAITPVLAPPPKSSQNNSMYSGDSSPRFNPFDKGFEDASSAEGVPPTEIKQIERTDSQESPATPLFDDDVSQPLEDFPRITYTGDGWEMQLRQPNKKRITAQRFWKKIWIKLAMQGDNPVLQLYNGPNDKEPFQELPLQACYSVSDVSAQQYDQFGKIFTVKLQYIFYKERPGVRPGQVTKAERLTSKLSQFAAYAIQGDYQGVKEFGSDLKKLGIPVEHAPQVSELFKLGSLNFEDMKQFSVCIEESLFKLDVHRDRALNYKTEEVQITAVDELYVEQDAEGHVLKQIARVRLFFLGFLSGMPYVELGVNDLWRQGKEVVGRHDIIPVVTEEWIRLEGVEFHTCVHQDEYEKTRTIKFQPPDACYIELMRFRIRPPKNRELPLQLKATWCVTGNKVELRADILVPGFASRKLGQIPCEDVMIRFPIPECWIYLFRVEKHFRYGSVKSAHRRTGKVKGIERILGAVEQLQESLIEVTSGSAKYEHQHRALVWRCPRLPKEGQGAYTTHQLVCRLALTSYDQIPQELAPFCYVEFTMPATQVSHTTVRSVSIQESDSDDPPEKYVRYLARHEYMVGIEHTTNESVNPYLAATHVKTATIREEPTKPVSPTPVVPQSDSDSDSN